MAAARAIRLVTARPSLQACEVDADWLEPWMLREDWRDDRRAFVCVDFASWPEDLPIDPLPPVPVIGVASDDHPRAGDADVLAGEDVSLAVLTRAIHAAPKASAVVVHLLRCIEGLPLNAALTCESLAFAALQGGGEHSAWLQSRQHSAVPGAPGTVRVTREDDALHVHLDRPWALNAIDRPIRDALFDAFSLAALDEDIARVTLRGEGRSFSIGADLAEFGTASDPAEAHAIRMRTLPARALVQRPAILEAHVHGACVGAGLEIAAFAARFTATPDAWFQLPETAMGILPGAGGCVSVSRRIGRQRAAALILSGKRISARTALAWGLIDAIVDPPA